MNRTLWNGQQRETPDVELSKITKAGAVFQMVSVLYLVDTLIVVKIDILVN